MQLKVQQSHSVYQRLLLWHCRLEEAVNMREIINFLLHRCRFPRSMLVTHINMKFGVTTCFWFSGRLQTCRQTARTSQCCFRNTCSKTVVSKYPARFLDREEVTRKCKRTRWMWLVRGLVWLAERLTHFCVTSSGLLALSVWDSAVVLDCSRRVLNLVVSYFAPQLL